MIFFEGAPLSALKAFSDERRQVFQMFVNPTSIANKLRIQQRPDVAGDDWMVRMLQTPTEEVLKEFFMPYMAVWRSNMRAVVGRAMVREEWTNCRNEARFAP